MTQTSKKAQITPDYLFCFFGACSLALGFNEFWYRAIAAGLTHVILAVASFMLAFGLRGNLIPAIGICSSIGLSLGENHSCSAAFAIAGGIIGFVIGYMHDLVETPLPSVPPAISSENVKQ